MSGSDAPPILFLDWDGVLNNATGQVGQVDPACARRLNDLLRETNADLVISSTWRSMVHSGFMTERGFQEMLWSHGIYRANVVGVTRKEPRWGEEGRGSQIDDWLSEAGHTGPYAVVDDNQLWLDTDRVSVRDLHFVQTDGDLGLTDEDCAKLKAYLRPARA